MVFVRSVVTCSALVRIHACYGSPGLKFATLGAGHGSKQYGCLQMQPCGICTHVRYFLLGHGGLSLGDFVLLQRGCVINRCGQSAVSKQTRSTGQVVIAPALIKAPIVGHRPELGRRGPAGAGGQPWQVRAARRLRPAPPGRQPRPHQPPLRPQRMPRQPSSACLGPVSKPRLIRAGRVG